MSSKEKDGGGAVMGSEMMKEKDKHDGEVKMHSKMVIKRRKIRRKMKNVDVGSISMEE